MNASFCVVPYVVGDWASANLSVYSPKEMHLARLAARKARDTESRKLEDDFYHPDWEQGYAKYRSTLDDKLLPGSSFLAVRTLQPDGKTRSHPRRVLGRLAVRKAPHPELLIPSPRCRSDSAAALARLSEADVCIINLQEIRGERMGGLVRELLAIRGAQRPTLIVCASPTDLLFLGQVPQLSEAVIVPIGSTPRTPEVSISLVGCDRPQVEREFELVLQQLRQESEMHERMVRAGVSAWWAAHQSLVADPQGDYAIRRFLNYLDKLTANDRANAADFKAFRQLLLRVLMDEKRISERLQAVEEAVVRQLNGDGGEIVVLVRQPGSAALVREKLAERLGGAVSDLRGIGVQVRSGRPAIASTELTIMLGFSGFSSLDAIMRTSPAHLALVVDPVEASLAVHASARTAHWLTRAGASASPMTAIGDAAQTVAIRNYGSTLVSGFDVFQVIALPEVQSTGPQAQNERVQRKLVLTLEDGDVLAVDATRRFDRIDPVTSLPKTVAAGSLQPGDQIVVTDDNLSFSERMIARLDDGVLQREAGLRQMWASLVTLQLESAHFKKTDLHRDLRERGVVVDYQTVRAWTTPTEAADRVPARWEHFRTLADLIHIDLPETELRNIFNAVRLLRTWHRKAGRDLVRMMRAAYTGRLDPVTLRRIESAFGLSVRELVEAARLALIDDIEVET